MNVRLIVFVALAAVVAGTTPARAQRAGQQQQKQVQPPALGTPRERRLLEQRLRTEFGRVVRNRLGLNDDQMNRLQQTNTKFEPRRRQLLAEETRARRALRMELARGDSANEQIVDEMLKRWQQVQRQRVDLNEEEQAELAQYLSPIARAKYLGLQDQFRQRIDQLLQGQGGAQTAPAGPLRGRRPRPR